MAGINAKGVGRRNAATRIVNASMTDAFVIIGGPGPFTLWAFDVIKLLAHGSKRNIRFIDRKDALSDKHESGIIYLTHYPSRDLIDAINRESIKVVLLAEDAVETFCYLMRGEKTSRNEALRTLSASTVAHWAISKSPSAQLIRRVGNQPVHDYIRLLSSLLDLKHDEPSINNVQARLAKSVAKSALLDDALLHHLPGFDPALARAAVDDVSSSALDKIIHPLLAIVQGAPELSIVWPTDVFLSGDRPNEPAATIASVTGPARVIIYGPYFHLPPAEYRVEIILAFSGHIEDIPFSLEILGSTSLARIRMDQRPTGGYRASFNFIHCDPVDALEIHLRNERGAIDGQIALVELRFNAIG